MHLRAAAIHFQSLHRRDCNFLHAPAQRSAAGALRRWRTDPRFLFRRRHSARAFRLGLASLAIALSGPEAPARDAVPIPRLRPSIPANTPIIPLPRPRPAIPTPEEVATEPPPPSACQLRLTADIAVVEALRQITGANGCGIDDPVRLSGVITKDHVRIAITPPATLRCTTAEAVSLSRQVHQIRSVRTSDRCTR